MKFGRMTAAAMALLMLAGCAESPETDIVKHKDLEKVVSEAQQTDANKADVSDLRTNDRYTADLDNESLRVKLRADAVIDVPDTDTLSLLRVQQRRFTQEDCDRVRSALMGSKPLTALSEIEQIQTKAQIEAIVANKREELERERKQIAEDPQHAENVQQYAPDLLADLQKNIDKWQAMYENAPEKIDFAQYSADGTLRSNADLIAAEENENGFWHSYCRSIENGDTLWVASQDGRAMLHVQNSDNFSSCIWYSAAPNGFCDMGNYNIELLPMNELKLMDADLPAVPGETANLSREEAEQKAEGTLKQLGIADFQCCEAEKITTWEMLNVLCSTDCREREKDYQRTYWVLRYYRAVDGAVIEQASGSKVANVEEKDAFREKIWPAEVIEFRINDSGIARFQWNAPLEITETVVDRAAMKPFAEISTAFEKMLPVTAAVQDLDTDISIDRVTLSYSRISEKDSFDTGMIVPVWAFRGTRKVTGEDYIDEHLSFTGVQLALNAIDGSVINAELGY